MSQKITLKHIGFIMDGNGRWAEGRGLSRSQGHKEGFKALKSLIKILAEDDSLQQASFYCFSTENWNRPAIEVKFLMGLFKEIVDVNLKDLFNNNIQVNIKGDLSESSKFDKNLREKLNAINEKSLENPILTINLCINYGGKDEIARAAQNLVKTGQDITVESLETEILKTDLPLDLVVRTSGEQRLSNFLLWQSAYSEFIFTNYHWPDINVEKYNLIKEEYYHRNRRFGALNN